MDVKKKHVLRQDNTEKSYQFLIDQEVLSIMSYTAVR